MKNPAVICYGLLNCLLAACAGEAARPKDSDFRTVELKEQIRNEHDRLLGDMGWAELPDGTVQLNWKLDEFDNQAQPGAAYSLSPASSAGISQTSYASKNWDAQVNINSSTSAPFAALTCVMSEGGTALSVVVSAECKRGRKQGAPLAMGAGSKVLGSAWAFDWHTGSWVSNKSTNLNDLNLATSYASYLNVFVPAGIEAGGFYNQSHQPYVCYQGQRLATAAGEQGLSAAEILARHKTQSSTLVPVAAVDANPGFVLAAGMQCLELEVKAQLLRKLGASSGNVASDYNSVAKSMTASEKAEAINSTLGIAVTNTILFDPDFLSFPGYASVDNDFGPVVLGQTAASQEKKLFLSTKHVAKLAGAKHSPFESMLATLVGTGELRKSSTLPDGRVSLLSLLTTASELRKISATELKLPVSLQASALPASASSPLVPIALDGKVQSRVLFDLRPLNLGVLVDANRREVISEMRILGAEAKSRQLIVVPADTLRDFKQ